jgi:creatinine amidohydrolase
MKNSLGRDPRSVAQQRVAVLPVGTIEQHGPHLPLTDRRDYGDRDVARAVEQISGEAVLLPSVQYAFNEHHMDFPGTIAVQGPTFISYITDIGQSWHITVSRRSCC